MPAVKALLVHHATGSEALRSEIGWGLLSHSLGDLALCDDHEAHFVYQRDMPMTGAVRLLSAGARRLTGNVDIKATFSFYCDVDPEYAERLENADFPIEHRGLRAVARNLSGVRCLDGEDCGEVFFDVSSAETYGRFGALLTAEIVSVQPALP